MNRPLPLSAAIITWNEEPNLPRCLDTIRPLAAEIVVIDSGSTDRTCQIAAEFGAVVEHCPWQGFRAQKNTALQRCSQPWVLCLDADESLSPDLARSISETLTANPADLDGCAVNRRTFYLGKWIRHAWYPDWIVRLVRAGRAEWVGLDPHPYLRVTGATQRLTGDLLHRSFRDLEDHLQRTIKYARTTARSYEAAGRTFHSHHLIFSPMLAFLKCLLLKQAWRDGWRGWLIASVQAISTFAKYAFLLEPRLSRDPSAPPHPGA